MRRINRRPRLAQAGGGRITHTEYRDRRLGLCAAQILRDNYRRFWRANITSLRVNEDTLIRAGVALVRLAGTTLELSDWFIDRAGSVIEGPALAALTDSLEAMTAQTEFDDYWELLREFVECPPLAVYGIDIDEDDEYTGMPSLAIALQWVTMLAHDAMLESVGDVLRDNLCDTPRVDCRGVGERLTLLCSALDADGAEDINGIGLGTLLAFAHQRTGNDFADTGPHELYDTYGYGGGGTFDWETRPIAEMAREQRAARMITEAFGVLDDRISASGIELIALAETIARVAASIGLPVHWPGQSDDEEEDTNDTDHTAEEPALAAA